MAKNGSQNEDSRENLDFKSSDMKIVGNARIITEM